MATKANPTHVAKIVLEALRMGVTNREVVRSVTYGRQEELGVLEGIIREKSSGSAQVIVGGYGVGKSHLCELLSLRLENQGYAVARLELGASHSRAEYPKYVLEAIEQNLRVTVEGHTYQGMTDIALVRRAVDPKCADFWDWDTVALSHELFPEPDQLHERVSYLRDELPQVPGERFYNPFWMSISAKVPRELTAINRAVAELNCLAHKLKRAGVPGLIVLLDEAERSETLPRGAYRMERARDLILGLALASSNQSTTLLKHFRNENPSSNPYLPCGVSLVHTVFAFTYEWGLASELVQRLDIAPLVISRLEEEANDILLERVIGLCEEAYGYAPSLSSEQVTALLSERHTPDVRSTIRTIVSGLDYYRHLEEDGCSR